MNKRLSVLLTVILSSAAAGAGLSWWLSVPADVKIEERVPVQANVVERASVDEVNIEGRLRSFDGHPSSEPGMWPWFRGVNLDNVAGSDTRLARSWPENGPAEIWRVALGEGYAGPAVRNGRVYVLDYDLSEKADALRCFSLEDGKEIWRRSYKVRVKRNHGMSRTVPAVTDSHVVSIGPRCQVLCADAVTGAFAWGIDMVTVYGTKVPMWYTGQCPLIDGASVVIAPGGSSLMAGIDINTGKTLWETSNPDDWQMSHACVVPMTIDGVRMYVYPAIGGVVGVAADGPKVGEILWKTDLWKHSVVAPSPVLLGDGRILLTAGYGAGSMMIKVFRKDDEFNVSELTRWDRKQFACEQHTPIYYKDHLFTVLPADAGEFKRQLVCMRPDGKVMWRSDQEDRFGLGPFMIADGMILVMDDDGLLTMAEASISRYHRVAQAQVLHGRESWGPLAIAGSRLLVRDFKSMACLDVGE